MGCAGSKQPVTPAKTPGAPPSHSAGRVAPQPLSSTAPKQHSAWGDSQASAAASTAAAPSPVVKPAAEEPAASEKRPDDDEVEALEVLLTDRRRISGKRCVITVGRRGDMVVVKAFHPRSETEYETALSGGDLKELLPPDLQGEENEIAQLRFIRDNLRLTGDEDVGQELEVIPPGGRPFTVLATDRRRISGKRCVVTIGQREDGIVVKAFHPRSESEYELVMTPAELSAMLPEEMRGEEQETEQLRFIRDNLRLVGSEDVGQELELIPPGGRPLKVLLTDRRKVSGRKYVITIGQREDGVVVRAFNPTTGNEYELIMTPEELRALLPEEIRGEECETDQLRFICDHLQLEGSDFMGYDLELVPPSGPPVTVMFRDRRAVSDAFLSRTRRSLTRALQIDGHRAMVTIGSRVDGIVVRAFIPRLELEHEQVLTPGQLSALIPERLHGEECELQQLHWISENLHYTRNPGGKVKLEIVPQEALSVVTLADPVKEVSGAGTSLAIDPLAFADEEEETDGDGAAPVMIVFRDRRTIGGKRVAVTIGKRGATLVVRALNPASQQESELVLPLSQLTHLVPAELLTEEREIELLKHIANDLCFMPGFRGARDVLALKGSRDDAEAKGADGEAGAEEDEDDEGSAPSLQQLLRDRRTIGGLRVYVTVGRRDDMMVVNVFSPSRSAEQEIALPAGLLVHVVPLELISEDLEAELVHYLADCVEVEAVGESGIKVSLRGAPPVAPDGAPEAAFSKSLPVGGAAATVTAERRGDVLTFRVFDVGTEETTELNVSLRAVQAELSSGNSKERELTSDDSVNDLMEYLAHALNYEVTTVARKLGVVGVTSAGPVATRGLSHSLPGAEEGELYMLTLRRADDRVDATAVRVDTHAEAAGSISMDEVVEKLSAAGLDDVDRGALLKDVKVQALLEQVAKWAAVEGSTVVFRS